MLEPIQKIATRRSPSRLAIAEEPPQARDAPKTFVSALTSPFVELTRRLGVRTLALVLLLVAPYGTRRLLVPFGLLAALTNLFDMLLTVVGADYVVSCTAVLVDHVVGRRELDL